MALACFAVFSDILTRSRVQRGRLPMKARALLPVRLSPDVKAGNELTLAAQVFDISGHT